MAISFFLIVFVDFGSDIIGVREISINRNKPELLGKIFCTTYVVKAIILIFILTLAVLVFTTFPYFKTERELFLLGLSILIGQFFNPTWFLQGVENVKWITYLNVISKAIYVLGIFFIIKSESDYIYINLCWGVGMIIANFIFFIVIIKKHQFSFSIVSKREVFNHFKNDFSMFSSQISFPI